MTLDAYNKELKRIFDDTSPAAPSTAAKEEIEAAIAELSERLKGPLDNTERLWLVEDRRELRKQLAALHAGENFIRR